MKIQKGTVKWFNRIKGYGFAEPENGGNDVFIHISEIEKQGISDLNEGQEIFFSTESKNGKTSAVDVKLVD